MPSAATKPAKATSTTNQPPLVVGLGIPLRKRRTTAKAKAQLEQPARPKREPKPKPAPAAEQEQPKADGLASTAEQRAALPTFAKNDPEKLAGAALRALAYERGIARSEAERLTDHKLREQLRYITAHRFEE